MNKNVLGFFTKCVSVLYNVTKETVNLREMTGEVMAFL